MPTVYEDVILGPLEKNLDVDMVRRNVDCVLRQMNLVSLIKKASSCLSDGQKRSAAMAAVLSVSPEILLLDEPDIGLDPHNYNNLVQVFRELHQTLIISTCHLAFAAAVADRVIVLNEGQITADGKPAEILNDEKLLTAHGLV
jgi:cobalt/nickel transport system ATP-binding protein